jgi:hypothetical protein
MTEARLDTLLGFAIRPAQSLSEVDTAGLHGDLISLLFSLAYHPSMSQN